VPNPAPDPGTQYLGIGGVPQTGITSYGFNGYIDEIHIYDTNRTFTQFDTTGGGKAFNRGYNEGFGGGFNP